jgi:peptide/nickel transport system permease protein
MSERPKRSYKRVAAIRRTFARYAAKPLNLAALIFLVLVILLALLADLLAAEKPLACQLDGQLYVLPALSDPPALADHDNRTITEAIAARGGWAVLPPVPFGPNQSKVAGNVGLLREPDPAHLLGTDDAGRDVLARIIHGARSAVIVGLGSMALSALLGVLIGALAAYFGGPTDRLALLLIESLTAFPTLFLILALQGLLGTGSLIQLVVIIGATRWTDVARVTRAEVLRVVNEDYVDAARALGLGHPRILLRHVLPGSIGPVLVASTFGIAGAILIESTLSFLGFGAPAPTASWGQLLTDAFANDGCYWLAIFPGLVLFATVLSINLAGEGLRDAVEAR